MTAGEGLFSIQRSRFPPSIDAVRYWPADLRGSSLMFRKNQTIGIMGYYLPGDVVLINVSIDGRSRKKIRPAVVMIAGMGKDLSVCPVTSKPASDSASIPLSIDDFAEGGLDLFFESYVLLSIPVTIRTGDIVGKKGRLCGETFSEIASRVKEAMSPANGAGCETQKSLKNAHNS